MKTVAGSAGGLRKSALTALMLLSVGNEVAVRCVERQLMGGVLSKFRTPGGKGLA